MIAMYLYVYFHFAFEVRETTNLFWILFHELLQPPLLQMLNIASFYAHSSSVARNQVPKEVFKNRSSNQVIY